MHTCYVYSSVVIDRYNYEKPDRGCDFLLVKSFVIIVALASYGYHSNAFLENVDNYIVILA